MLPWSSCSGNLPTTSVSVRYGMLMQVADNRTIVGVACPPGRAVDE